MILALSLSCFPLQQRKKVVKCFPTEKLDIHISHTCVYVVFCEVVLTKSNLLASPALLMQGALHPVSETHRLQVAGHFVK